MTLQQEVPVATENLLLNLTCIGKGHWGHVKTGMYYNGTHHDQLIESSHLGIDRKLVKKSGNVLSWPRLTRLPRLEWSKRGGLVGRAVLLDYCHWAQRNNISYSPMSNHSITIENLEAMAADQGVTFQTGDILIVRSGFVKWYNEHDDAERLESVTNGKAWIGVENTEKAVEWLWNKHFAAVAGDTVGFEVWPPVQKGFGKLAQASSFQHSINHFLELHDHVLALLGMPIGELWDLEALAEECQKQNRWTFFFTSAPLNITGGIASPPNALAIF